MGLEVVRELARLAPDSRPRPASRQPGEANVITSSRRDKGVTAL